MNTVTYEELKQVIGQAGLANAAICLHSSLKSFGYVEGGADAVIQAWLDSGCTLVVPTFTYECETPPPPQRPLILQNGLDEADLAAIRPNASYRQHSRMISPSMGAIPAKILEKTATVRGNHPLNSFAALGPLAAAIIATQSPDNVYGPLKQVYQHAAAFMVLIGVDLTKATPLHFAEEKAGRRLFRRWGRDVDNGIVETQVGSCSDGFNRLQPFVAHIEQRITVGASNWRIYPFRQFIDIAARVIAQNPAITHCDDQLCVRCNDAVKGGPILD